MTGLLLCLPQESILHLPESLVVANQLRWATAAKTPENCAISRVYRLHSLRTNQSLREHGALVLLLTVSVSEGRRGARGKKTAVDASVPIIE